MSTTALSELFRLLADQVQCVLLNACYSTVQAKSICQHIGYVIGMNQPIGDRAAIEFAFGFYSAIANGKSYDFAYHFGCNSIRSAGIDEADIPVLQKPGSSTTNPSLWIHGWAELARKDVPDMELDWRKYFDSATRTVPEPATWDAVLLPELERVKTSLAQAQDHIILRSTLPLTGILAVGFTFQIRGGYQFLFEQITQAEKLQWRSYEPPSALKFQVKEENGNAGKNLLIMFSITGSGLSDVMQLFQQSSEQFDALVYAEPETGVGGKAIASNADATALAIHAKELMNTYRQKYHASTIHLILYSPASFSLFLGQHLNAMGEVVAYERTQSGSYQAAITLQTR